jgi:hypothetical protein
MSSIHEPTCPIPPEQLVWLLRRAPSADVSAIDALSPKLRVELATFCAARAHMRDLALIVASRCERRDLERATGIPGAMLFAQSRDTGPRREPGRAKPVISLARQAS